MRRRFLLFTSLIIFAAPFVIGVILAIGAVPGQATLRFSLSLRTIRENLVPVLVGKEPKEAFLPSAIVSIQISLATSICSVLIAAPVALLIGTRFRKHLSKVAAFALGLRVLPIVTSIATFESLQSFAGFSQSIALVIGIETCGLLPMTITMLAAGAWPDLALGETILSLDGTMSTWERLKLRLHTIGPDLALAAGATFMLSWSDFIFPHFFIDDQYHKTVSQLLADTQGFLGTNWGALGAMVCLAILPPACITVAAVILMRVRQMGANGGFESV